MPRDPRLGRRLLLVNLKLQLETATDIDDQIPLPSAATDDDDQIGPHH